MPGLIDEGEQRVAVAVVTKLVDVLEVARCGPLVPVFVPRAAVVPHGARRQGAAERLGIHVGEHEDFAGGPFLGDTRHEIPVIELDTREVRRGGKLNLTGCAGGRL